MPVALAAAVSLGVILLRWHGVDWPAQLYRVHLFRADGWIAFDTRWYGGHVPIAYSILFPPLAATVGLTGASVVCAAVGAWAFDRLVTRRYGARARLGSLVFAAGTMVQVAIGQLPNLLGMTLGLLALLALVTRWPRLAALLALACALASFVAAMFLVMGLVAHAMLHPGSLRRQALGVALAATVPVPVVGLLYHQGGTFPYPGTSLAGVLVICLGVFVIAPRSERVLHLGAALYAALALVLFVVHTPMGANLTRLGTTLALPVLISVVPRPRRAALLLLATFVVTWQLLPMVGAIGIDSRDPSTRRAYFAPMLAELRHVASGPTRIEIPFTHEHWEASFVAPSVSLARGWERQLDISENSIFYQPNALNPTTYRRWLNDKGVTFVALPDAPLDYSARAEAALLRHGAGYLKPIWRDGHWRLWQVRGSPGLVTGSARLTSFVAGGFTVDAAHSGTITVRVRYTAQWSIVDNDHGACLSQDPSGWTVVRASRPGSIHVVSQLLPTGAAAC